MRAMGFVSWASLHIASILQASAFKSEYGNILVDTLLEKERNTRSRMQIWNLLHDPQFHHFYAIAHLKKKKNNNNN